MWQRGLVLLGTMDKVRVGNYVMGYAAGVAPSGYGRWRSVLEKPHHGMWRHALVLLGTMDNVVVESNSISYNAAISASEACGNMHWYC